MVVPEKDDILDIIIYIIIKNNLNEVGLSLEYLRFLMGEHMEDILFEWRLDSYRVDLYVANQIIMDS